MNIRPSSLLSIVVVFISIVLGWSASAQEINRLSKQEIARAITQGALKSEFPNKLLFKSSNGSEQVGHIQYTFDHRYHADMAKVYLQYKPDYAGFVAIDVETGAILNLTSFVKSGEDWDNLVMRAEYPAASVFKIITAAAGIDLGKLNANSVIPYNGKSTTLYKNQVLNHSDNKWTRKPTFKESFAKSINPVFAQVGIFHLGADNLLNYAERFGFDRSIDTDFELPQSKVNLDLSEEWAIAEAASGYTREITLSPIHAAQIAATIANDGKEVIPYMVDSINSENGQLLYKANSQNEGRQVISASTAHALKGLMTETTRIGSARSSFTSLNRYKVYSDMDIGGKTGSLTGFSPKGRHDWFMGFAEKDGRKIAYASLIVNVEKWYVRSAYVARQFIYHYFSDIAEAEQERLAKLEPITTEN